MMKTLIEQHCAGGIFIEHIMTKWALLIIDRLAAEPLRFYVLRDSIPDISEKMLIQNLNVLLRDGLLSKTVEYSKPPKVTYELTEIGHELATQYIDFKGWIASRIMVINQAQQNYDRNFPKL